MAQRNPFEEIMRARQIFRNREFLRHTYVPDRLLHRDEQVRQLARILAAPLRGETPSNILVYGKPGTGKTATVRYVGRELEAASSGAPLRTSVVYLNCEIVNTHYRVLASLAEGLLERMNNGPNRTDLPRIPKTGWPVDEVYRTLLKILEMDGGLHVVVLDEIDKLVRRDGGDVLYSLTRINLELRKAKTCLIGISNNLNFMDLLDARVRSSLGGEEVIFPPYNAKQLSDILEERASMSFCDGVVADGVIPLCAAYAAREHGDARRALDLLRVAGETAEAEGAEQVTVEHVRKAHERLEQDHMVEIIRTLPLQSKLVLLAVSLLAQRGPRPVISGEVYECYRDVCHRTGMEPLTRRRVSDLISELDLLGIIDAKIVNKGRYGRTKEVKLNVHPLQVQAVIQEDAMLAAPASDLLTVPLR